MLPGVDKEKAVHMTDITSMNTPSVSCRQSRNYAHKKSVQSVIGSALFRHNFEIQNDKILTKFEEGHKDLQT